MILNLFLFSLVYFGSVDNEWTYHFYTFKEPKEIGRVVFIQRETKNLKVVSENPLKYYYGSCIYQEFTHHQYLNFIVSNWLSEKYHFNLHDFNALAEVWQTKTIEHVLEDPNTILPIEDPNTITLPYVEGICYWLSPKHKQHLYYDCMYIVNKEGVSPTPCLEEPNSICLTCVARRLRDSD